MDAETQEDRRMSVDQKTGGDKNTEVHGNASEREGRRETKRSLPMDSQTDRIAQVDVVMQGSEKSESDRSSPGGCDGTRKGWGLQAAERTQGKTAGVQQTGDTVRGACPQHERSHRSVHEQSRPTLQGPQTPTFGGS